MKVYDSTKFLHYENIKLKKETLKLLEEASEVYNENFNNPENKVWYGRCLFLSWYCSLGTCKFCYRSTVKHKVRHTETSKRNIAGVLVEVLLCKKLNWRIEFLTGGYDIISWEEMLETIKLITKVYEEKIWLNLGVLDRDKLESVRPFVKGIVASVETANPELHDFVCPNKPLQPYEEMFRIIDEMNCFKKSIAVIVGLGNTREWKKQDDIKHLINFVRKYKLDRITVYALKPVNRTIYAEGPDSDEYLSWIAKLRIEFPKLEIIGGTNLRRSEEIPFLLRAGANAITKFPGTKQFGTEKTKKIVSKIKEEGRKFTSELVNLPEVDWDEEINNIDVSQDIKFEMKRRLKGYIRTFKNPCDEDKKYC